MPTLARRVVPGHESVANRNGKITTAGFKP